MTYEEIYASYREKVLAYLTDRTPSPEHAEDLCEDVFEQIGRSLPRYDAQKASLSTWIYRITRFTLIDDIRTRHITEPLDEELGYDAGYDEALIKEATLEKLASTLSAMDEELRNLIILRYYRKKTLKEISRMTGISYGMVRVKHKRALAILREKLI
ncbi:MAG: sigma-70 family RNA polymerase sigma factor [Oscillospiraceae bacterium]|nr:sigma-70 family RNA polymerase sigma factor [Oscillospiraceae bacterium]